MRQGAPQLASSSQLQQQQQRRGREEEEEAAGSARAWPPRAPLLGPPSSHAEGCDLRFSALRICTNFFARAESFSATCGGRVGWRRRRWHRSDAPSSHAPSAA